MAYMQRRQETVAATTIQSAGRMFIDRQNYCRRLKESKYRTEVSRELLSTEEYYLNQLRLVVEVFVHPLKKAVEAGRPIITDSEIRAIFSTIEVIVRINTELLQELKTRIRDWGPNQKLGDVFIKMADCFKIYTNYVQHFSEALKMVQECSKKSEQFTEFCKKGFVDIGDPLASLSSYLITPIQRIPRYQLLLKDLLKHTWSDHPDFDNITLALDLITKTAVHVNEKQKEAENISKCIYVQNSLTGKKIENLLDSSRRFVREGALTEVVMEGKGKTIKMKKRWFFLFSDIVVRCELPNQKATIKRRSSAANVALASSSGDAKTYEYIGKVHLQKASIVNMGDEGEKKHAFELVTSHDSLWLCSDTEEDKNQWMEALAACIKSSTSRADEIDRHLTAVAVKKASTAKTLIDSKYIALRVHGNGAQSGPDDLESSSYHSLSASERLDLEQRAAERVRSLTCEEREQNDLAKQRGADFQAYMTNKHHTLQPEQLQRGSARASSNGSSKREKKARRGTASGESSSPRRAFASLKKHSKGKSEAKMDMNGASKVIDYPTFGEEDDSEGPPRLQRSPGIRSLSIEAIQQAQAEENSRSSHERKDGSAIVAESTSPRLRKFASLRRESIGASAPAGMQAQRGSASPPPTDASDSRKPGDSDDQGEDSGSTIDSDASPRLRKFAKMRRESYNSLPRPGLTESPTRSSGNTPSSSGTASPSPSPVASPEVEQRVSVSAAPADDAPKTRKFAQRNNLYKNLGAVS